MPKTTIDYSNTVFYKILCNDRSITDLYVGHTTNFIQRKHTHKQNCTNPKSSNYNYNLYEIIRKNGGWHNWSMEIIIVLNCDDHHAAKMKEREYIVELNANLSISDKQSSLGGSSGQYRVLVNRDYKNTSNDKKVLDKPRSKNNTDADTDTKRANIVHRFYCEKCNFKCSKTYDMDRHMMTAKHKKMGKYLQKASFTPDSPPHQCSCGKIYYHRQSLFNHKKKCSAESDTLENTFVSDTTVCVTTKPIVTNDMILNLIEQNQELQKQLVELTKQTTIINNTTNNTMNAQFNLNMFLNEDCKDAINIADFIESLKVSVNDLKQTGKLGYTEGITRIFVNALKNLDVTMRPLHCTDIKRETVYIKDQDIWEKENAEKTKLRNVLHQISRKNLKVLPIWQQENPDFRYLDTPENEQFLQISLGAIGPAFVDEQEKQDDKIIRNVLKEVILDKGKKIIC